MDIRTGGQTDRHTDSQTGWVADIYRRNDCCETDENILFYHVLLIPPVG